MTNIYGEYNGFPGYTPGIKLIIRGKEIDLFYKIGPYDYRFLKKGAIENDKILICSKNNMILLKSFVAFVEPEPTYDAPSPSTRKKSFKDLELLCTSLI